LQRSRSLARCCTMKLSLSATNSAVVFESLCDERWHASAAVKTSVSLRQ